MATIPQVEPKRRTSEELAVELLQVVEEHFDGMGLTEAERDERYDALDRSLNARGATRARA
jgi:hypothetical protein